MQPNWTRGFKALPSSKVIVPLIVRPLKVPRHTYLQVNILPCKMNTKDIVWCFFFKTGRLTTLKRSFDIDSPL